MLLGLLASLPHDHPVLRLCVFLASVAGCIVLSVIAWRGTRKRPRRPEGDRRRRGRF